MRITEEVRKALASTPRGDPRVTLAEQIIRQIISSLEVPCPALVYVGTDCCLVRVDAEVPDSDKELVVAQAVIREASMKIYNEMYRRQNPRADHYPPL